MHVLVFLRFVSICLKVQSHFKSAYAARFIQRIHPPFTKVTALQAEWMQKGGNRFHRMGCRFRGVFGQG